MNGEITRDELSTGLDQELVFDTDKVKSLVDIEIKGRTLVNLLGRAGNAIYQQFPSEVGNGVTVEFNSDVIKLTKNVYDNNWLVNWSDKNVMRSGKNYLCAVEARVAGAASSGENPTIYIMPSDAKVRHGNLSTNSQTFETIYFLTGRNDTSASAGNNAYYIDISIGNNTAPGDIAEFRNFRIYELLDEEYDELIAQGALPGNEIAARYPYVDDVKCVVNPYLENKEDLLSGLQWGYYSSDESGVVPGSSDDFPHIGFGHFIPCEPNTTYTLFNPFSDEQAHLSARVSLATTDKNASTGGWADNNGKSITITTSPNTAYLTVHFTNKHSGASLRAIQKGELIPTLVKGSVPKSHKECHNSRIMFETKLYDGETITRRNDGAYVKNTEWEELDLTNCLPAYNSKKTGVHMVYFGIDNEGIVSKTRPLELAKVIKFDGTILGQALGDSPLNWSADECFYYSSGFGEIYRLTLTIPNSLTGWGDDYSPTTDEIKAFFLGWRMSQKNTGGQPYNNTGEKEWTKLWCGIGTAVLYGGALCVSSSNVEACPTTINDYGYTPYRLIYKRETPIIEEVKTYGELVVNNSVDVSVGSGLVLGERFKPVHNGTQYVFNTNNLSNGARGNNRIDSIVKVLDGDAFVQYFEQIDNGIRNGRSQCKLIDFDGQSVYADYLIYYPDTITSFEYSLKEAKTVKEVLNKSQEEIANCFEELAKTKRQLKRAEEELRQRSNPNLLINGDFQIWQRGESFDATVCHGKYIMDRWFLYSYLKNTAAIAPGTFSKIGSYGFKYTATSTEERVVFMGQKLEDSTPFLGKPLTLSVKIKNIAGYAEIVINRSTSNTASSNICTAIKADKPGIFKVTAQMPNTLTGLITAVIGFNNCSSAEIEWVKLEVGEHATPFVPRNYTEELTMCKRFFERIGNARSGILADTFTITPGTKKWLASLSYARKRTHPTINFANISNYRVFMMNTVSGGTTAQLLSGLGIQGYTESSAAIVISVASPYDSTNYYHANLQRTDDATAAYIGVDAEIY